MHLKAKDVIARAEKAEARKDLWREIYEDCYEFALPQRNLYDGYYEGRSVASKKWSGFMIQPPFTPPSALPIASNPRYFPLIAPGAG